MTSAVLIPLIGLLLFPVAAAAEETRSRRLWVWESGPVLHDPNARGSFLDFCERHGIGAVSIQIGVSGSAGRRRLENATSWKALLQDAHRRGMTVHALHGDPGYALRSQHGVVLSAVDAVIAYNASVVPAERFDGIHLDIEPYLLAEWKEPRQREQLLVEYVELHERAAERSRAADLAYTADLPFWWYATDDVTGEAVSMTTFHGVRKPATDHLLDFVDNIGLMAYRNVAAGSDGVIALAMPRFGAQIRPGTCGCSSASRLEKSPTECRRRSLSQASRWLR
jgi:hypothetical protein